MNPKGSSNVTLLKRFSRLIMPVIFIAAAASTATAQKEVDAPAPIPTCARTITADVIAFDQIIFYNRFGSFDPGGMMYALRRDVVPITGTQIGPGNAQLRPDKRPRPIVMRVNEGDCLQVTFTNMLTPNRADVENLQFANMPARRPYWDKPPFFGQIIIQPDGTTRKIIINPDGTVKVIEIDLQGVEHLIDDGGVHLEKEDTPATRVASMHVNGLDYMPPGAAGILSDGANVGLNTSSLASPGQTKVYTWYAAKQGQYLVHSMGATSGGEGDGGQPVHGLFGSVNVEPAGSKWYRSQVTAAVLNAVKDATPTPIGQPKISNYDKTFSNGDPILNILKGTEIIYTDLNAIISNFTDTADGCLSGGSRIDPPSGTCGQWFREFSVLFHDELESGKPAFPELHADEPVFHSVRDGFGINYGSSGLGAILLANRKKVGPTKDCPECSFEEFFLSSWPNGDPALLVRNNSTGQATQAAFPDDPANVHHAYLGDPVRFRNVHMGPKETHVFHLHAHQWLATPRDQNSTYLDSQTISPGAAFTYEINYGGGGNRNFTPGDAIFHCHLYPHFAQGMWELWRNHDVWETGAADRNVPDGEIAAGVPTPAIIPIPGRPMPLMPTATFKGYPFYIAANAGHRASQPPLSLERNGGLPRHQVLSGTTTDGLPAIPPFRQNDMVFQRVRSMNNDPNLVNFARHLATANIQLLPDNGTATEQNAMKFHQGTLPGGQAVPRTQYDWPARGYPTYTPSGGSGVFFLVNGRIPPAGQVAQPGAPFADPCSDSFLNDNGVRVPVPLRNYRTAWIQFGADGPPFDPHVTLKVNDVGWHDRQGRITVLEQDVFPTLNGTRAPEPLFIRVRSGDCVNYRATNLVPGALNLDDFEVYQGTDTVGQHIHLVKFDVTSSDGAANGFNYENGAFSAEEVQHRIAANNLYQQQTGGSQILTAQTNPTFGAGLNNEWVGAQTLIERWWADTLVNRQGKDRTLRTIFTHDHMSPSGHQHHGLYAGLISEPQGSTWTSLDGNTVFGGRPDGGPTSYASNILAGPQQTQSFREFGLNIADFAIVYTPRNPDSSRTSGNIPINPPNRKEFAPPWIVGSIDIDHPERYPFPEAISSADPGTQLINYTQEPIPLRIGQISQGQFVQKTGPAGDLSNVFSSVIHGDPFTPLLKAYPGDRIQIRLLQGAQEEQHVINIHGHRWFFEPGTPFSNFENNSGLTNAQAIGISEHFEFDFTDRVLPIFVRDLNVADYLYQSAPADNLWDGQWGILRAYRFTQPDVARLPAGLNAAAVIGEETALPPNPFAEPAALSDASRPAPNEDIDDFDPAATTNPDDPDPELDDLIKEEDAVATTGAQIQPDSGGRNGINSCANFPGPGTPPIKKFIIEAWVASTLINDPRGIIYNPRFNFKDPAGIVFINARDRAAIRNGTKILEPLVIRVNKGDCVEVRLRNRLPNVLPTYDSFNHMPPIIPRFNFNQVQTSNRVSLHPQVLGYDVSGSDGSLVGYNPNTTVRPHNKIRYAWYAGRVSSNGQSVVLTPAELGITHLRDVGDVIKHASHGLIGALVVEPAGANYKDTVTGATLFSGAQADIVNSSNQPLFREFVSHYQDDVTMQDADGAITFEGQVFTNTGMRNIGGTDDSEDSGQKAFNYKHEPFWARLNLPPETDEGTMNDQIYTNILSSKVSHAACIFATGRPCDPATPIFTAQVGTTVRFRVLEAAGHSRQHGFTIFGHHWQFEPWTSNSTNQGNNPLTFEIGSYSGIGPTRHLNILTQAGGLTRVVGDFLYRTQESFNFSGGMWGIFRVGPSLSPAP